MTGSEIPSVVRRADEEMALVDWPRARPVGDIVVSGRDCLVTAMGFEERAVAGLRRACESTEGFQVGLVRYLPALEQNREGEFREISKAAGLRVKEFVYDRERPAGMGLRLASYMAGFDRVYVDISGMSRLLIVQTLTALVAKGKECVLLYSEAEVYPPSREQYERERSRNAPSPSFISSGIFEVASTPELSSVAMLGSAIRMIAFLSFDPSQLANLFQEIQPTHSNLIRGVSPHAQLGWRTDAVGEMNETTVRMQRDVDGHEACTFDYRVTLGLIVGLYGQHAAFNRIVVAPTGSKMQAVAIGIVRGVLADLQVVYPTPREFLEPERYTEGVREVFRIPFRWDALLG